MEIVFGEFSERLKFILLHDLLALLLLSKMGSEKAVHPPTFAIQQAQYQSNVNHNKQPLGIVLHELKRHMHELKPPGEIDFGELSFVTAHELSEETLRSRLWIVSLQVDAWLQKQRQSIWVL